MTLPNGNRKSRARPSTWVGRSVTQDQSSRSWFRINSSVQRPRAPLAERCKRLSQFSTEFLLFHWPRNVRNRLCSSMWKTDSLAYRRPPVIPGHTRLCIIFTYFRTHGSLKLLGKCFLFSVCATERFLGLDLDIVWVVSVREIDWTFQYSIRNYLEMTRLRIFMQI